MALDSPIKVDVPANLLTVNTFRPDEVIPVYDEINRSANFSGTWSSPAATPLIWVALRKVMVITSLLFHLTNILGGNDVTRYNADTIWRTNNGAPGGSATLITPDSTTMATMLI